MTSIIRASIIIPTYNSPIINKTIDALNNQTYDQPFEIIISGTDDYNLIKDGLNLTFINQKEKKNPSQNRNAALRLAKGKYVLFLDADCIPNKDWIKNMMEDEHDFVGSAVNLMTDDKWSTYDNIIHFYEILKKKKIIGPDDFNTMGMKVPLDAIKKIGFFDEELVAGEDTEFSHRLAQNGATFYLSKKAILKHMSPRNSLRGILNHSMHWGRYSYVVRIKFGKVPLLLRNKYIFLMLSPLIAFYVSTKIFMIPELRKFIFIFPIAYLAKLAWCAGAFLGVKK